MRRLALALLAVSTLACTQARGSKAPAAPIGGWIDESTLGRPSDAADVDRLAALAEAGPAGRVIRLDRLLDLYDAARFAGDAAARDTLWLALGGSSTTRGHEASREALLRLLDEAYALDEPSAASHLDEAQQRFVADVIALVSADLFLPDSSESLVDQLLGYRLLAEQGHPRVADNAHFRLYDFVRGVIEGAIETSPGARHEVAVHALYAEREDISAWLDDAPPHAQPPLPSSASLWALIDAQLAALREQPRWQAVLDARAVADATLHDTAFELLPRPRDPSWTLVELPRGSAAPESLAPIVRLHAGMLALEPGGPDAEQLALADAGSHARASERIEGLLARDGRGIVLLAAEPELPAPDFAAALRAIVEARASTIELAVHEPKIADQSGMVVVALPLHVVQEGELSPGARAIRDARVHVRLSGRGTQVAIDDRWLSESPDLPSDLRSLVARVHEAYPTERVIRLSLAPDVQPRQLIELLAAFVGGRTPAFVAAGWAWDQPLPELPTQLDARVDRVLIERAALAKPRTPALELPEGLALGERDRSRVDELARDLAACVPELERALPRSGLDFVLRFADGKLVEAGATAKGAAKDRIAALERCADERLIGARLRDHLDPLVLHVRFL